MFQVLLSLPSKHNDRLPIRKRGEANTHVRMYVCKCSPCFKKQTETDIDKSKHFLLESIFFFSSLLSKKPPPVTHIPTAMSIHRPIDHIGRGEHLHEEAVVYSFLIFHIYYYTLLNKYYALSRSYLLY